MFTCLRCSKTKTEDIPIDSDAHITYTVEDDASNTAACTEAGTMKQQEICSRCGETIGETTIDTKPLGHLFSEPIYEWNDDLSSAYAKRICQRDGAVRWSLRRQKQILR